VKWTVVLTKQAVKDAKKLTEAGLKKKAKKFLNQLEKDPYKPPFKKTVGDLNGFYSRRINRQHRIVYKIYRKKGIIHIIRRNKTTYSGIKV